MNQNEQQPERTALQTSIQRKKDRVKNIENPSEFSWEYVERVVLNREITEDEKLLSVEREQIESAYFDGYDNTSIDHGELGNIEKYQFPDSEDYYTKKYGTDGK